MDEKTRKKQIRKDFSRQGWILLIYYGILNLSVMLCNVIGAVIESISTFIEYGVSVSYEYLEQRIYESSMGNGWGYFLAIAVGFLILLMWKGKEFTFHELYQKGKPMTFRDLMSILCIFMSAQFLFQIFATLVELLLNLFGLSALAALESATLSGVDTFSMFLYAGLLAPIAEEILFRGVILRGLLPYGKKLAIFVSALLFGLFHGNILQSPFAFAVGLVLGFVAVEYSLVWAMALHMFNNLVISDMLTRITYDLPALASGIINSVVIFGFAIAGFVFALVRRDEISAYLRRETMNRYYLKRCFSSAGIIVLMVVMSVCMILTITIL